MVVDERKNVPPQGNTKTERKLGNPLTQLFGRIAPHIGAWQIYPVSVLICIAIYFQLTGIAQGLWYDLIGFSSVLAILIGVQRHRPARSAPWYTVAAGLMMLVIGDVFLNGYDSLFHREIPFPSIADAFFLLGNFTVIVALAMMIRIRVPGGDAASLIDAAIIATGAGALAWTFLMVPYAKDESLTFLQRYVSISYPFMDVLMLALAARLVFTPGTRPRSFHLIGIAIVCTLVADVVYDELVLTGDYYKGHPIDAIWLLWYAFWGAAALHPSMRAVAEPGPTPQTQLTKGRLAMLATAALLLPVARLIQWVRVEPVDVPVTSIGTAVMFLLVLLRMSGLIKALESGRHKLESVVSREQTLRAAAAALVSAPTRDEINKVALDAAPTLVGDPRAEVRILVDEQDSFLVVASTGDRDGELREMSTDFHSLPISAYEALASQQSTTVARREDRTLWQALQFGDDCEVAYLFPLVIQQELQGVMAVTSAKQLSEGARGALEALGSQAALALESAALAEDLHRRKSEERFRSLVRNASDVIAITEADGTFRYVSPSVERVLGYRPEDLVATSSFALIFPEDLERARTFHAEILTTTDATQTIEYRIRHADGNWHHVEAIGNNLLDDPTVRGIVINARDITERKLAQEELAYQAFHDALTKLPNRALFMDRLNQALTHAARRRENVALLFLDIDRFKVVNDSLGHEAGDLLLIAVAERVRSCLRAGDTAARLGGDEFTILLEGIADESEATVVAERVASLFGPAIDLGGRSVFVTASIGIALAKPGHVGPADLLREADIAMYQAKAKGKASHAVFDAKMGSAALDRLELETNLRHAIEHGEFILHYQPELDLDTGRIVALEALVRWQHPERGLVPPAEFIPIAEETGLILPLGRWVLAEAARQGRIWYDRDPDDHPTISVNLSAKQFQHSTIVEDVARILTETGLPPECLTLEITETAVMEDAESNQATLQRFKDLGVRLAIDDFGSGYSSLGYLKRFPVDMLKIDRAFINGLGRDPEDTAIVEAVTGLASMLGMQVTAEGVETADQASRVRNLGCALGQGFYFARALPPLEAQKMLEQHLPVPSPLPVEAKPGKVAVT